MNEFFKKSYEHELERKNQLSMAVTVPISMSTVSIGILKYVTDNVNNGYSYNTLTIASLFLCAFFILRFFALLKPFLDFGAYQVLAKADQYFEHIEALEKFSADFPDSPSPADTFESQLASDYSKYATINATVNDRRGEILYELNLTAYMLVLFSLLSAATVLLAKHI